MSVTTPESFWFDDVRLQAQETEEKKELLLFQWLSTLEKDLMKFTIVMFSITKSNQRHIESLLTKYIFASTPKPNKPVRNLIARCLNIIYAKGDSKTLFDTFTGIQSSLTRKIELSEAKIAGICVLGAITQIHGEKVLSLFSESVLIISKFLKNAKDNEVTLKFECYNALALSVKGAGRAANEQSAKDLYKLAKGGLNERAYLLRTAAFELLESVHKFTSYPPPITLSDYESTCNSCVKAADSKKASLRNACASYIATLLSISQKSAPLQRNSIKNSDDQNILSIAEILTLLSSCYIKLTSLECRMAWIEGWAVFLRSTGILFLENNYSLITNACFDLISNSKLQKDKNDAYVVKQAALYLVRDVVGKTISESGQLRACRELVKELNTAHTIAESKVVGILAALTALLSDLGPAAFSVQDDILDPLLSLIGHPSPAVKLELAAALREICLALPQKITKTMNRLVVVIQRELPQMNTEKPESIEKVAGYGHILSSIIGIISSRSLFAAYEDAATIFGLATQLLKTHLNAKDYRIMASQSQIGWTLIGSLMTLGPNFVRVHVSQLLLIWKNVFPKVQPKDSSINRGELEWYYLLVSRESALAALESFMYFNSKDLISIDVAKRIMICLNNSLQFLSTLIGAYGPVDEKTPSPFQMKLYERECRLKSRLFICFKLLNPVSVFDSIYTPLIRAVVDTFALDPEKSDRFLATLGTKDGALFGNIGGKDTGALVIETVTPTSLISGSLITVADDSGAEEKSIFKYSLHDAQIEAIDNIISRKEQRSFENDPHALYLTSVISAIENKNAAETQVSQLVPSAHSSIAVVDSAIQLFALIFPLQNAQTQETVMEQLIKAATYQGGRVTPIRKAACQINSLVAVIGSLKYCAGKKGQLQSQKVSVAMRDLMAFFVKSPDTGLRSAACEIAGRVARINGNPLFINPIMQDFIDLVVNNRNPDARAGACLAMGSIFHFVGGIAAGSHIRNSVGIFTTLAADPHPRVHTWALHSLYLTIESAGLSYGPFVNSTLSLIAKLCMSPTHETSAAALIIPNSDEDSEVYPEFGRILYSLLGVLGPELQDSSKVRDMCLNLFELLKNDLDPFVVVEAIRCIQNFIMFAPKYVDIPVIIPFLQKHLTTGSKSHDSIVRNAAVTCLYQLTQRDPGSVLGAAVGDCLEEQLFSLLDLEIDSAVRDEIKDILLSLLRYVSPSKPSRWIDMCRNILSKSMPVESSDFVTGRKEELIKDFDDGDDMEAGVQPAKQVKISKPVMQIALLPRWRTQVFSLTCLQIVIQVVVMANRPEDFNLELARKKCKEDGDQSKDFLVFRTADLIRLSFNASTGSVTFLKLSGLKLLHVILENFASVADPEYENHRLLEQFEAQIISALAPGFEVDSPPEVTSEGCKVASYFLCSGILTDVSMNCRPVKLLTSLLDQFMGVEPKANGRAPNAQVVVKLSVLSAWATLYSNASKNLRSELFSAELLLAIFTLWIQSLREYSLLGDDADQVDLAESGSNPALYGIASKFVTLPYYNLVWIDILRSVTDVIDELSPAAFDAFPDYSQNTDTSTDPPASLFNLLGLCVRFISNSTGNSAKTPLDAEKYAICITAIKKLTTKRVLGSHDLPGELLLELLSIFDKLSQTEDVAVQSAILDCMNQYLFQFGTSFFSEAANCLGESHYRFLRILYHGIANFVPGLTLNPNARSYDFFDLVSNSRALTTSNVLILSKSLELFQSILESPLIGAAAKEFIACFMLTLITGIYRDLRLAKIDDPRLIDVIPNFLAFYKTSLLKIPNLDFIRAGMSVIMSKLEIARANLRSDEFAAFKNLSLALVITLTTLPRIYVHEIQNCVSKCLLESFCKSENSKIIRFTCLQSMTALMLLCANPDSKISAYGDIYVRIFLPSITQELIHESKLLLNGKDNSELVEELIKSYLLLLTAYSSEQAKFQAATLIMTLFLQIADLLKESRDQKCHNIFLLVCGTFLQLASKSQFIFKSVMHVFTDEQKRRLEDFMKVFVNSKTQDGEFASFPNPQRADEIRGNPKILLKRFGDSY